MNELLKLNPYAVVICVASGISLIVLSKMYDKVLAKEGKKPSWPFRIWSVFFWCILVLMMLGPDIFGLVPEKQ